METILQRQNVDKPEEHGLYAGNRKNEKLQHTLNNNEAWRNGITSGLAEMLKVMMER